MTPPATATRDQVIAEWAASHARYRQIAAGVARGLANANPGDPVESSMKISKRFAATDTMAVNARRLLTDEGIIHKSGRRYYVT